MAKETKTVMIMITEQCNLNCIYCYEKNKSLNSMSKEKIINILQKELNEADGFDICEIQFFGGEPFLEFELIKSVCEYLWDNKWDKEYYCFATTNGTLVHNEIKEWLYNHRQQFICALSLDGNRDAHNINRCNSYDDIDHDFFRETWPFQPAKMTISPKSLQYLAESIIELHEREWGFENNFAYGVDWSNKAFANELEKQLNKVASYYIKHPEKPLCKLIGMELEHVIAEDRIGRWCGAGVSLKAYDVKGEMYPCHLFAPISNDMKYSNDNIKNIFSKDENADEKCMECSIYNICPTCYGSNYAATGYIEKRDDALCYLTKICALSASYIWAKRLNQYSIEKLGLTERKAINLLYAVKKIQYELMI